MMTSRLARLLVLSTLPLLTLGAFAFGCSSSTDGPDRVNNSTTSDSGLEGSPDGSHPPPDPNDGRDELPASCYAGCSNTLFACKTGTENAKADLVPEMTGCSGKLTTGDKVQAMKLDCNEHKVCLADTADGTPSNCAPSLFSAVSFAYKIGSATQHTICTRVQQ